MTHANPVAPAGRRRRAILSVLFLACSGLGTGCGGGRASTELVDAAATAPVASFTFAPRSPAGGQAVAFTDTSTGSPTAWRWTFGDGSTSPLRNPSRAYVASGTFTVTLTATNAAGSSSASQSIVVATPEPGPTACASATDCSVAGACPSDAAKGCACSPTPQGSICVPQCATAADCPKPPDQVLVCSTDGLCVPGESGGGGSGSGMSIDDTVSDQAQSATIAFDGLAFVTGSFCAQTFYPPGAALAVIQAAQAERDRAKLASRTLTIREKERVRAVRAKAGAPPLESRPEPKDRTFLLGRRADISTWV